MENVRTGECLWVTKGIDALMSGYSGEPPIVKMLRGARTPTLDEALRCRAFEW